MNQVMPSVLTAVIPITPFRDDSERLDLWIKSNDLSAIRLILVFDSVSPSEKIELLVKSSKTNSILVEYGEFNGPGNARNHGLKMVETEWVCFWDSDDLPLIKNVQILLTELQGKQVDVVIGEFETAKSKEIGRYENLKDHRHKSNDLIALISNPGIWRFVFRTEATSGVFFPDTLMGEDQVFLAKFFTTPKKIVWVSYPIYRYIQHGGTQLTRVKSSIDDLVNSARLISSNIRFMDPQTKRFGIALVLKQCLTIMKKSKLSLKLSSFFLGLGILIRNPMIGIYTIITILFLSGSETRGNVHVVLNGGLGNQLFELAAGLYYSDGRQIILESSIGYPRQLESKIAALEGFSFPSQVKFARHRRWYFYSKYTNLQLRRGLSGKSGMKDGLISFLGKLLTFTYFKNIVNVKVNSGVGWDKDFRLTSRNELIIGYFQSHKTQNDYILDLLQKSLSALENESLTEFLANSESQNPLIVHVRLGDYKEEPNFGIPGIRYYHEAIRALYNSKVHSGIWLFSDEADLALNRVPSELLEVTKVCASVGGSDLATLVAMMQGSDYVIANSTYGWWAARLSRNKNARVAYPDPWFRTMPVPNQLIPPNWLPFSSNFENS